MESFYDRLKKACAYKNVSIEEMLSECCLSKTNIYRWSNGGLPNGDTLIRISEYLGTSVDVLLTGKEPQFSITETALVLSFRKLSIDEKNYILTEMEDLLRKGEKHADN